jgi:predicted N-acyltransferase
MKKTFQLRPEGKNPDRVLEAIKHEVRKYIKRERRRVPPEGMDYWDFDCKFGATQEGAEVVHLSALTGLMDGVAKEAGSQFYVEILARAAKRKAKPADIAGAADGA